MTVRNTVVLVKAAQKNVPLQKALELWLAVTQCASWSNLVDVRRTFPSADGARIKTAGGGAVVVTVFNVRGNEYRLITVLNYGAATVLVCAVLTHAEYDKNQWKDRL